MHLVSFPRVFDNIPLTKLCLEQGHYDWGMLAYTVGFGGSMIWFGSSAGVAIMNKFPEARNVVQWVKKGWHVTAAYIIGFLVLYLIMGWEPADNREHKIKNCPVPGCPMGNNAAPDKETLSYPEVINNNPKVLTLAREIKIHYYEKTYNSLFNIDACNGIRHRGTGKKH